jgi:uncharacterized protein YbcI
MNGEPRQADVNARARKLEGDDGPGSPVPEARLQSLQGGELNQAITSALVGIHNRYLGRGPRSASTFYHDNVVVTLMYGVLTRAEKTLSETNRGEAVSQMRHLFQQTMDADFRAAVERLTGRKVVAFISGNDLDPDVAGEVFVLDQPPS